MDIDYKICIAFSCFGLFFLFIFISGDIINIWRKENHRHIEAMAKYRFEHQENVVK